MNLGWGAIGRSPAPKAIANFCYHRCMAVTAASISLLALTGCSTAISDQYEATAKATYTWQVHYATNPSRKQERIETYSSNSLLNRNGQKPEGAVIGPDDRGLWWSAMPPRPTLDEVEQRQQPGEQASKPELLQSVDYQFIYRQGSQTVALPTNYDVYRQVAKIYPDKVPLKLTLGVNDASVEKVEISK